MFAVLGLLALPLSAATFEARSPHHALSVERSVKADGEVTFDVRVTDLDSNRVLLTRTLGGRDETRYAETTGDPGVTLFIGEKPDMLIATMTVNSGEMTTDSINANWSLAPSKKVSLNAPLRVGGPVKAPVVRHRVEPFYPEAARKNKVEGIVILEATIDASGNVRDVRPLKPLPDGLSEAAAAALKQWKFAPGTLDGRPVDVIFNVTFSFRLDQNKIPFPGEG
jgi:TonB family protein